MEIFKEETMKTTFKSLVAMLATTVALSTLAPFEVQAEGRSNPREMGAQAFNEATEGKRVAWVPIWMGVLESEWTQVMREAFERYDIEFQLRDPNFSNDAALQAVTALINDGVDVLIVQNNSTTALAGELQRAMEMGIYVVQVNMASNAVGDAYVGVDWVEIGNMIGREMLETCGGGNGSGKVALIQGEATAAGSVDQLKGVMETLATDPSIDVVLSQPASWDANRANQLATTAIQQHPDLCAIHGFWGPMTAGAAQAVKNAGKLGEISVYASSDGQEGDCALVEQGLFTKALSYRADIQGEAIVNAVLTVLQNGDTPGSKHLNYISNQYWVEGPEDARYCYADPTSN